MEPFLRCIQDQIDRAIDAAGGLLDDARSALGMGLDNDAASSGGRSAARPDADGSGSSDLQWNDGVRDSFLNWLKDPLVIDLDGDGVELVALATSAANFDLGAAGFAERTGWVSADDGLLALDVNGNGRIDNISELFGDATTDGFVELATLDSNKDGVIDSEDASIGKNPISRARSRRALAERARERV